MDVLGSWASRAGNELVIDAKAPAVKVRCRLLVAADLALIINDSQFGHRLGHELCVAAVLKGDLGRTLLINDSFIMVHQSLPQASLLTRVHIASTPVLPAYISALFQQPPLRDARNLPLQSVF